MQQQPQLSVIVPVYNVESYLPLCIDSLRNQTLRNIEIILVDDESPDSCPVLCDKYAKQDSRIKVIHKKNAGLGFARNSGLEIATGKYVTFVDSDDYIDTDAYKALCRMAEENDLDILRFNYNRFTEKGKFYDENHQSKKLKIYSNPQDIRQLALYLFSIPIKRKPKLRSLGGSACVGIYKHTLLSSKHIWFHSERELVSEDVVFSYDCLLHAKQIGKYDFSYYHYRVNPQSLTTQTKLDKLDKATYFCKYVTDRMKKDGFDSEDAEIYPMGYFIDAIRAQVKIILQSPLPTKIKTTWFKEQMSKSYVEEIHRKYPVKIMPLKHRIHFFVAYHKFYSLMKILVYLNEFRKQQ